MDDETAFRFLAQCSFEDFFEMVCRNHSGRTSILHKIFSFRTVSYTTDNTNRCCPCAFQHEFCEYVCAGGEIDRDMVESLTRNISNGHCPHVDGERSVCSTSSISGLNIAAARGAEFTQQLMNLEIESIYSRYHESVFGIDFNLRKEVLQERHKVEAFCKQFFKIDNNYFRLVFTKDLRLICAIRYSSDTCSNLVKLENISLLEYCVRERNCTLIKALTLHRLRHADIIRALQLAFRHDLEPGQIIASNDIYTYLVGVICNCYYRYRDFIPFGILTLMYNQNNALRHTLYTRQCSKDIYRNNCDAQFLSDTGREFKRYECLVTLANNGFYAQPYEKDEKQYRLFDYIRRCPNFHIVKGLIDMGADDIVSPPRVSSYETTYLGELEVPSPEEREIGKAFHRDILELLIYENVNIGINTKSVERALLWDEYYLDINTCHLVYELGNASLEIKLDVKEHGRFGHEGEYDFALNFTAPLLIECGYPVTRQLLYEFLTIDLHPSEKRYLRECMDVPRSLKLCCRDVLRKTFKGRNLHKFVENQNIARSVRDFILLKPILKCLDTDKLKDEEGENLKARNHINAQLSRIERSLKEGEHLRKTSAPLNRPSATEQPKSEKAISQRKTYRGSSEDPTTERCCTLL